MRLSRIGLTAVLFFVVGQGIAPAQEIPDSDDVHRATTGQLETDPLMKALNNSPKSTEGIVAEAPLLILHGFDFFGSAPSSDCNEWNKFESLLRGYGYDRQIITLAYYDGDKNCDHWINHHGNHQSVAHFGHIGGHNRHTHLGHLAYHFAKYVEDHWSGVSNVSIVAHSMGGLIARYGVARVGDSGWPFMMTKDVVTLGTPHRGTNRARYCSGYGQCEQMKPESPFIEWLEANAQNPQAYPETNWTLIGSYGDENVPSGSATGMRAAHKAIYELGEGPEGCVCRGVIHHSDYRSTDSGYPWTVYYKDGAEWRHWAAGPVPPRWIYRSLIKSTW